MASKPVNKPRIGNGLLAVDEAHPGEILSVDTELLDRKAAAVRVRFVPKDRALGIVNPDAGKARMRNAGKLDDIGEVGIRRLSRLAPCADVFADARGGIGADNEAGRLVVAHPDLDRDTACLDRTLALLRARLLDQAHAILKREAKSEFDDGCGKPARAQQAGDGADCSGDGPGAGAVGREAENCEPEQERQDPH